MVINLELLTVSMVLSLSFELLKKRALSFLRNARIDIESGDYDLALFHAEQFAQLHSKYLLYRRIRDFPKTSHLVRLLRDLFKVYNDCGLRELLDRNLEGFYLLEEAYISTRYLPREYDRDIALRILALCERLMEVFNCLESRS